MRRRRSGARAPRRRACWLLVLSCCIPWIATVAQEEERADVLRALELEASGKYREAAVIFRSALRTAPTAGALLGLERTYAELHMSDSLLSPLDSLIARRPRDPLYRSVQLRTLQILRRDDQLRAAFERWTREVPSDPAPYREFARVLIQLGRPAAADSIVQRGRLALGSARDLQYETAQLRAAMGQWTASATAWRGALASAPHLASTAAYALAPTPASVRDSVRGTLFATPAEAGARRALGELELIWGRPHAAWDAMRTLTPDTTTARVWEEFGERALHDERFALARDALRAALGVRRTPDLEVLAATAAVRAGSPADVFTLAPLGEMEPDPPRLAREYLPVHVEALAALGRVADAEALVARFDRYLVPGQRLRLAQLVATAWVRRGNLVRAREALAAGGVDADSSEAAGWLALYEGRLGAARTLLRTSRDPSPELAFALGLVARTSAEAAPELGAAFLALARRDSAAAIAALVVAAARHEELAPGLLLAASRLHGARGNTSAALALWSRIVADYAGTPEAVESELEWSRALRGRGDQAGAIVHLEHLILSAPHSALLPQARRELELARGAVPPSR